MSAEDLIRAGGATLAFDTNAIIGFTKDEHLVVFGGFFNICDDASRLRSDDASPLAISMVVPALARMEALHDLRVQRGARPFDANVIKEGLASKARIADFNDDAAIGASGVLYRWFPDDEAWQRAKRERCLEALRLQKEHPTKGHGLASIDWAIAAQAEAEGWILVTADGRAEFENVSYKITRQALRALLDKLLEERGLAPSRARRR